MEDYRAMRERQSREVNAFPMVFAFSHEQFVDGMKKLGLEPTDTDKVYKLADTGGIYRRSDAPAFNSMFERHFKELHDAIEADADGTGFIYQMFLYELANHEYIITFDLEPTLDALCLSIEEVLASPAMFSGLKKAKADYLAQYEKKGRKKA